MRLKLLLLLIAVAIGSVSCASRAKRKACERTNWFHHGQNIAMAGQRLDADPLFKECQSVEANVSFAELDQGFKAGMAKYCDNDNVFEVGKAGKPFAYEMCDGESKSKMKNRYTEGLKVFCTPSNAYRFGSSGAVYQNVCPNNLEEAWLTEYRRGRKIYLTAAITEKERETSRLDLELVRMEHLIHRLKIQKLHAEAQQEMRRESVYDPATSTYKERTYYVPSHAGQNEANRLHTEISVLNSRIAEARRQREQLHLEISKMRTEMVAL